MYSKYLNGILQELYASYWLLNFTKIMIASHSAVNIDLMKREYVKPNIKIIISFVKDHIFEFTNKLRTHLKNKLIFLINKTSEKRRKLSRSYPRQIRYSQVAYKHANTIVRS